MPRDRVPDAVAAAHVIQTAALEVAADWHRTGSRAAPTLREAEVRRALGDMLYRYLFAPL